MDLKQQYHIKMNSVMNDYERKLKMVQMDLTKSQNEKDLLLKGLRQARDTNAEVKEQIGKYKTALANEKRQNRQTSKQLDKEHDLLEKTKEKRKIGSIPSC